MTDRELLELAAKATEIATHDAMRADWLNGSSTYWNPLADDGDALRLAVNLRMRIHHDGYYAFVEIPTGGKYCWTTSAMVEGKDHYAAMRRAIVRAAAEIGKGASHDN